MFIKTSRSAAIRQALARRAHTARTSDDLEVLTRYALGQLTQEQANQQLQAQGRALRLA